MKKIWILALIFLFSHKLYPSKQPEDVEITIGIKSEIPWNNKIKFIEFICHQNDYIFIPDIKSVLQYKPIIALREDSDTQRKLDFLIINFILLDNGEIRFQMINSKNATKYTIEADNNDEMESKFISRIESYSKTRNERTHTGNYIAPSDNKYTNYEIGKAFYERGDLDSAITYLNKSVLENKYIDKSYYLLSLCYKNIGNKTDYYKSINNCLTANEQNGSCQIELGNYYLHAGETSKAITIYKQQLQSNKYKDLAYWNLFVSYKKLGRDTTAYSYLNNIDLFSGYYIKAQLLLEKHNEEIIRRNTQRNNIILAIRLGAIGIVIILVAKLFINMQKGKAIGEQKFTLITMITGALIALAIDFLKELI